MKVTRLLAAVALAMAALTACGDSDGGTGDSTVSTTGEPGGATTDPADGSAENTEVPATTHTSEDAVDAPVPPDEDIEAPLGPGVMNFQFVECEQFAMVAPVDADAARSIVPSEHQVLVDAEGLATLTHVSKVCNDIVVEGESMGPGQFDTQWISITGPADERTYLEYAEHVVLPTDYLYPLNLQTDNVDFRDALAAFGTPIVLSESSEMEPMGPGPQSGSLVVADGGYDWSVDNITEVDTLVYFVHILEQVDEGLEYRYEIECPATVMWWEGAAQLEPVPGSAVQEAFGPEITGLGYGVDLSCNVTIDRTFEITVTEDIDYTESKQLDVYAPVSGSAQPVVVFLHGGDPTRSPDTRRARPEAFALAAQGLVVYVPHWASLGPAGGSQDTVCATAFAQATADEYGGDPERVTLSGYSSGGYGAAVLGLIGDEPPLPVSDCLVDPTMDLPGAIVAGGTPFFVAEAARIGAYPLPEWTDLTPDQVDAFDPYLVLGRNPDVHIVLVVGENDVGGGGLGEIPIAESNLEYYQALVDAGYDAELVLLPGGHIEPINPVTEQFDTWVSTIVDTAYAVS